MSQQSVVDLFRKTYGEEPDVFSKAPGRLEILGNHTDYNEGYVLSTAVDCYTFMALAKRSDNTCRLASPSIEDCVRTFELSELEEPLPGNDWTNYIRGVVHELLARGVELSGFDLVLESNVPLSAGMSSSAALEMSLLCGMDTLFNLNLGLTEKAKIGQACENNYIGANTGLMDQFTSLAGRENSFVLSEYRDLSVKELDIPRGYSLVVINSGVKHDLSQEYNERRQQCEEALSSLQKFYPTAKALRDISVGQLKKHELAMSEDAFKRALHITQENERVLEAIRLLADNDTEAFGELLFASHLSSQENFENSCPELDFLIEVARSSNLCLGSRLSGGGFGGISLHLVQSDRAQDYCNYIQKTFKNHYGILPDSYICKSANGASATILKEALV
jgi:galactokinase